MNDSSASTLGRPWYGTCHSCQPEQGQREVPRKPGHCSLIRQMPIRDPDERSDLAA
jgi:hypothetical protein